MSDDLSESTTIAKQGAITFVGKVLSRVAGFVFLLVVTRLIGPSTYGAFVLATAIISFANRIFGLSIDRSVDYFIPEYLSNGEYGKAKSVLVNAFLIGTIGGILGIAVIFIASNQLSKLSNKPKLVSILPILSLIIPLAIYNSILLNSFSSIKKLKYRVYTEDVARSAGKILITAGLLMLGLEATGLALGHLLALLLSVLVGFYFLLKNYENVIHGEIKPISTKEMLSYSLPLVFSGLIFSLVGQIDYLVIGYYTTTDAVGRYRVGYQLASYLLIGLLALTPIIKPLISEEKNNAGAIRARYQLATRWITMITLPMGVTLALAPQLYLSVLFTAQYATAGSSIVILIAGYIFNSAIGPEGKIIQGLGHTRLTLFNSIVLLVINGSLDVLLVPRLGIIGAAIGTASALSIAGIVGVIEVYYLRRIHPFTTNLIKIFLSGTGGLIVGNLFVALVQSDITSAVLLPVVVSISYLCCLIGLRSFIEEDLKIAGLVDNKIGYQIVAPIMSLRR